jgi:hypothetical protein
MLRWTENLSRVNRLIVDWPNTHILRVDKVMAISLRKSEVRSGR